MAPILPENITIALEDDNLIINQRWFSSKHILFLIIGICCSSFVILILVGGTPDCGLLPPGLIAISSMYYSIIGIVNHSIITISPTTLNIVCKPIPCFKSTMLDCNNIMQLFIKQTVDNTINTRQYNHRYNLYILTYDDKYVKLISDIPTFKQAQYLEVYIEKHLGLENIEISSEYKNRSKIKTSQDIEDKKIEFSTLLDNIPYLHKTQDYSDLKATGNYKDYYLSINMLPNISTKITLTAPIPETTSTTNKITPPPQKELDRDTLKQLFYSINDYVKLENNGQHISYITEKEINSSEELETLFANLSAILENYTNIIYTGGAAITELQYISQQINHPFQTIAIELLEIIIQQNANRFGKNPTRWLCLNCLSRYTAYKLNTTLFKTLTYYACKTCGKNHPAYKHPGQIILVLDNNLQKKYFEKDNAFYINWFQYKTFLDFDTVEIIAATDKDIEHLAIQIGNDTDPTRKNTYKQRSYSIDPTCTLSANSLKLLERSFKTKNYN